MGMSRLTERPGDDDEDDRYGWRAVSRSGHMVVIVV